MDHLQIKKQILELKLALVHIQLEKNLIIKQQQYEKAADLRDQERGTMEQLERLKELILKELGLLKLAPSSLEETHHVLQLLSEFNHDETEKTYMSIRNSFLEGLKMEYEELWNERKRLQREFRMKEAHQLHTQLMEIGSFLVKWG
jgi:hypothetical protein